MAAEALEASVLDSKDKEQLLAIAQALGIKTNARASKATLIGKILETTGTAPSAASSATSDAVSEAASTARTEEAAPPIAAPQAAGTRPGRAPRPAPPIRLLSKPRSCSDPTASPSPTGRSP